jgi:hypothetical protein
MDDTHSYGGFLFFEKCSGCETVLLQNFEICGNCNIVKAKLNLADMGSESNEAAVAFKRPTERRNKLVPRLLIGPDT